MAEAAAAFYAVETAVEGAAIGAIAVSQATTPLHIRFRDLGKPPSSLVWDACAGHSLNVVKGKAYVFGGDVSSGNSDTNMRIVTLPSGVEDGELDYQVVESEFDNTRPLQEYSLSQRRGSSALEDILIHGELQPDISVQNLQSLAFHVSTAIDSNIFVLAGRASKSADENRQNSAFGDGQLVNCDHIYVFSTLTNKWSTIQADFAKCAAGIPQPRIGASCDSTPHPRPEVAVDVTAHSHGTIFLHGGHSSQGELLRDTWAFDVSSRTWSRWPDLPIPLPEEIAGDGRIVCVGNTLWRVGDGFGKMTHIDFDIARGEVVNQTSGPHMAEASIKLLQETWSVISPSQKAATTAIQAEIGAGVEKPVLDNAEVLPVPRQGAGFVPVQLSAGRIFLLYFMGQDGPGNMLNDVWSFQIQADDLSPAAVKDMVREKVGKSSGKHEWAQCDLVESTKKEGLVDLPGGLTAFAADSWKDLGGGNVVLWGGVDADGELKSQCWVMTVQYVKIDVWELMYETASLSICPSQGVYEYEEFRALSKCLQS